MTVKAESPVTTKDLLATSIKRMRWVGVSPKNRTKITVAYGTIILCINLITFILLGIYLYVNNYQDNTKFMYDVTLFVGYWQFIIKCWTLLLKHKAISKLININNTKFWTLDTNVLTKDDKQKIQSIYDFVKIIISIYTKAVMAILSGHYVNTYLSGKKNSVLNIWLPKSIQDIVYTSPGHEIFFIYQITFMSLCELIFIIECDSVFIVFLASVIAQIRILKMRLNLIGDNFTVKENMLNLVENIKQQNIIFEYLKTIEDIFSQALLQILGSNMLAAVLCLLACFTQNNISDMWAYIAFLPYIAIQLFVFCFVGQYIQDETLSVAEAAYRCNWQDVPNKNVHLMIMMIIGRAQRQFNITMGGILILCLETFTGISRTLLSFLTFMINIQIDKN